MSSATTYKNIPVIVSIYPRSRGVFESVGIHSRSGKDHGIVVRFHPFSEIRVQEILGERDILHLVILSVDAGVEDSWFISGEDGGRSRPAAVYIEWF